MEDEDDLREPDEDEFADVTKREMLEYYFRERVRFYIRTEQAIVEEEDWVERSAVRTNMLDAFSDG